MYNDLQAEQVLLTDEMKKERSSAIQKNEAELKEYQKKVFGFGGLFFLEKTGVDQAHSRQSMGRS
jgi:outer membrane protein